MFALNALDVDEKLMRVLTFLIFLIINAVISGVNVCDGCVCSVFWAFVGRESILPAWFCTHVLLTVC